MAENIVVDPESSKTISHDVQTDKEKALVSWVMSLVDRWETHRRTEYDDLWDEYERLVEGKWDAKDKTRDSERSRLISPALQQAVESTTAELEEATFGRGTGIWFDVADDVTDPDKEDMGFLRNILREDIEFAEMDCEIRKTFWNGCVFGTGISKISVQDKEELVPVNDIDPLTGVASTKSELKKKFVVKLQAINPREFVIDPSARTVDEALGCAHILMKPRHTITEMQRAGQYNNNFLGSVREDTNQTRITGSVEEDQVKIVEYYGMVPANLLTAGKKEEEGTLIDSDNLEMVESIVTIGNDTVLLRAAENPMVMKDRPIIAYQHDTVNDSFWGRGVCAKGYNPQKALDGELRARMDAMALTAHPMMGVDASRLPRGAKMQVRPGKVWLANGNPREIFNPIDLGQPNAATFHQSGDLERMVSMGTGAMDSAAPTSQNPRNATASGMSMMTSQFVKRSKRTLWNIDKSYLGKLVHKTAYRYMQFDTERYPVMDYKFKVVSGMGIMARELEQGQLTQLLSIIPPDSPVFGVILEGVFENSSLTNKTELQAALKQQLAPPSPEQQQAQQEQQELAKQAAVMEVKETESKVIKNLADAQAKGANVQIAQQTVDVQKVQAVTQATSQESIADGNRNTGTV